MDYANKRPAPAATGHGGKRLSPVSTPDSTTAPREAQLQREMAAVRAEVDQLAKPRVNVTEAERAAVGLRLVELEERLCWIEREQQRLASGEVGNE